jgi:hypothetical protein
MNGMNENATQNESAVQANPSLSENPYVQELFAILQDNGRDTAGLTALLGHVSEMESFVKRAEDKISDMKSQLAEMKEIQNHPVKSALKSAIQTLEHKVAEVKVRLGELKHNIAEGCKAAVEAFKEKGISALDKLASFFHIKSVVQSLDKSVHQAANFCDKSVQQIDNFSREYRTASRAIKNIGRLLIGKEPIEVTKEAGFISKTLAAPYKAEKAVLLKISGLANVAVKKLEQLETKAETQQTRRAAEKKPSIIGELEANIKMLAEQNLSRAAPERAVAKGAEL